MEGFRKQVLLTPIRALPVLVVPVLVFSQSALGAATNLGSYGQTTLQQNTGDAVQLTCGGFVGAGADPDAIPLFATCRAMVHTGNELTGSGLSTFSLGLSEDELAAALQQIATEEYASTQAIAAEISTDKMDPISDRLNNLRTGVSTFNLVVNGLPSDFYGGNAGANEPGSRLSGYTHLNYGFGDRDGNDRSNEFDYNNYNLTAGLDYRIDDNIVVGSALSYYRIDSDFEESPEVAGGSTDVDSFGLVFYSTWSSDQFYVDGLIGYSRSSYDLSREILIPNVVATIEETTKASPDSDDINMSVGVGYSQNSGHLSWGPYARLSYQRVEIDSYQETGAETTGLNLAVDSQTWTSLTSVLGLSLSWVKSTDKAILIPGLRLGWIHQFKNEASNINAVYVDDPRSNTLVARTNDPDEDYAELGFQISSVLKSGTQFFFSYDTLLGFEDLTNHALTFGVRMDF